MKSMLRVAVLVVALASARSTLAFGLPSLPGGGGASPADVDAFMAQSASAQKLVNTSSRALFKAVASKEQMAEIDARLTATNGITDPKEKEAAIEKIREDERVAVAKQMEASDADQKVAALDATKKEAVKSGIWNLGLGLLVDTDLAARGKKFVSGPPNPMIATKLPDLKNAIASIGGQMGSLGKVLAASKKLMSAVGLEALPTSASEKPKTVNDEG